MSLREILLPLFWPLVLVAFVGLLLAGYFGRGLRGRALFFHGRGRPHHLVARGQIMLWLTAAVGALILLAFLISGASRLLYSPDRKPPVETTNSGAVIP